MQTAAETDNPDHQLRVLAPVPTRYRRSEPGHRKPKGSDSGKKLFLFKVCFCQEKNHNLQNTSSLFLFTFK